jgi:hypothetical protein
VDVERLRTLYGNAPSTFVASRDALVKELRASGAKDEAAAVKQLRRHSPAQWALNRVASLAPDVVAAFSAAAADLRDAHAAAIEGRAGGDVRGAMTRLREQANAVVARAGSIDASVAAADVGALLTEIAADESATRQFEAGILGASRTEDVDPFEGLQPKTRARQRPEKQTERRQPAQTKTRETKTPAPDPRAEQAAKRAHVQRLTRERQDTRKELSDALAREKEASRHVADLERQLAKAQRALAEVAAGRVELEALIARLNVEIDAES